MSHDHATVAEEEYLQTIFWLQEAGLPMTGANVARAMQLSAPTVHEMIGRLERDGYVTRAADKTLAFTENGREHAEGVVRRHRLIERFLTDVLGIPWDEVHEEAEILEHFLSEGLEDRIATRLGDPAVDPHGHPIPAKDGSVPATSGRPLWAVPEGERVEVGRVPDGEPEALRYLDGIGLRPGVRLEIVGRGPLGGPLFVRVESGPVEDHALSRELAEAIWVD